MEENNRLCPNCSASVDQDATNCPQCGSDLSSLAYSFQEKAEEMSDQINDAAAEISEKSQEVLEDVKENVANAIQDPHEPVEQVIEDIDQKVEEIRSTFITDPHAEKLPDAFAPSEVISEELPKSDGTSAKPASAIPAYVPKPREPQPVSEALPKHDTVVNDKPTGKKWLWIILIVIAVMILCLCGFTLFLILAASA